MKTREELDAEAVAFMKKCVQAHPGTEEMSLDEFLFEYEETLTYDEHDEGTAILQQFKEYGGDL